MSLTLEEALASLRVVALPMKTKFRGLELRETALFKGSAGWGEFAPFIEYNAHESLPWLESAIEQASIHFPAGPRSSIRVNATVPASDDEVRSKELFRGTPELIL